MPWLRSFVLIVVPALSVSLAGCASAPSGSDLRPAIPDLDSRLREPCRDPGIDSNAEVAIALHRRALQKCGQRGDLLVEYADKIRSGFGR